MGPARRFELAAWVLGLAMLGGYAVARLSNEGARKAGVEAYREAHAAAPAAAASAGAIEVDQSLWSEQRIAAYAASAPPAGAPGGVLRIPSVELEVPVYARLSEASLNRGAAHIEGTGLPGSAGNSGFAAHRDGFFRKLEHVAIDDEIELDVDGRTLTYRVVELAVVSPRETRVLDTGGTASVTLVTCYPFWFVGHAPRRYVVRAELHEDAFAAAPIDLSRARIDSNATMGGNRDEP